MGLFGWGRKAKAQQPAAPARMSQPRPASPLEYKEGDKIAGRYLVERVVSGGLGFIYFVEDLSVNAPASTPQAFVLKTYRDDLSHDLRPGFLREARAWVQLGRHPNIVPAFWVDEIAGRVFVAAERIWPDEAGRVSLHEYMVGQSRPLPQVLRWAVQFGYGMEHAVAHGLKIHRDIKPQNLLIGRDNDLQITDFGLSSVLPPTGSETGDSVSVGGTYPYMAPEQWRSQPCDVRSDIYAFGVVLYQLAFGRLPFSGATLRDLAFQHLQAKPAIPAHPLSKIIDTALAKSPGDRYQSVGDYLRAIESCAASQGVRLPPRPEVTDPDYLRREQLRTRSYLAAAGEADAALAAAKQLVAEWPTDASGWTQLGRLLSQRGDTAAAIKATERALALDQTRSAPWNNLGVLLNRQRNFVDAERALHASLDCDPDNTGAMANIAVSLHARGKSGEALEFLRRATELSPDKYSAWLGLGQLLIETGMRDEGLKALGTARSKAPASERTPIEAAITEARNQSHSQIDPAGYLATGRFAEAEEALRKQIAADPKDAAAWQNLAIACISQTKTEDARSALEQLALLEPSNEFAWMQLMQMASRRGDLPEAERWLAKFQAIPALAGRTKAFWSYILEENGQLQEARRLLLAAMKDYPKEPDVFIAFGDLAVKRKVPGHAIDPYRAAIRLLTGRHGESQRLADIRQRLAAAEEAWTREQGK
jgi:Flp pilus assembly protein TadD